MHSLHVALLEAPANQVWVNLPVKLHAQTQVNGTIRNLSLLNTCRHRKDYNSSLQTNFLRNSQGIVQTKAELPEYTEYVPGRQRLHSDALEDPKHH